MIHKNCTIYEHFSILKMRMNIFGMWFFSWRIHMLKSSFFTSKFINKKSLLILIIIHLNLDFSSLYSNWNISADCERSEENREGARRGSHCWGAAIRDPVQLSWNTCLLFKSRGWHRETREIWIRENYKKMDSLLFLISWVAEKLLLDQCHVWRKCTLYSVFSTT